jgi:LacI family transcriptional regulator
MAQVAERAGVSKNTVSLALRGSPRIPVETRERVEAAAKALGYQRNAAVGVLMAELRRSGSARFEATLALLNANEDPEAFRKHPTVPVYVAGARKRAAELGYGLDEFWLHDPDISGKRLASILKARGIRGSLCRQPRRQRPGSAHLQLRTNRHHVRADQLNQQLDQRNLQPRF